ncbi:class II glutamine amidotransferase [Paracoccus sp. (in: a-proteobacteria)]|uniref:class II glutamine amidotransferase n=1 Tax=Paracoccus sp. TaxID=267 RepID=UPI00321FF940
MCELFALSASAPVSIRYDLDRFAAEGGETQPNRDGWGIVFGEGRDAHWFREATAAANSPLDRFLREHERDHATVIAHVRNASRGGAALENTHPFRRVLAGRVQHFAHNGTLEGIEDLPRIAPCLAARIGQTDSELAFLHLLARIAAAAPDPEDIAGRFRVFAGFCAGMAALGPANFLWLDEVTLFVHADRRLTDIAPGRSELREPGLFMLEPAAPRTGRHHVIAGTHLRALPDHVLLFASVPLSAADWEPLARRTALAVRHGRLLCRATT